MEIGKCYIVFLCFLADLIKFWEGKDPRREMSTTPRSAWRPVWLKLRDRYVAVCSAGKVLFIFPLLDIPDIITTPTRETLRTSFSLLLWLHSGGRHWNQGGAALGTLPWGSASITWTWPIPIRLIKFPTTSSTATSTTCTAFARPTAPTCSWRRAGSRTTTWEASKDQTAAYPSGEAGER